MKKYFSNLSPATILILIVILTGGQSCASKRHVKQASKLEDAGLYEMAAENYLKAFNANSKNIEAATGLRRTGQRSLEAKATLVNQAYFSGNDKETVYNYLEAFAYQQRIGKTGIDLKMPEQAQSYWEEAKPKYLDSSFEEARLLLEEENFSKADEIFSEINRIDPSYRDLNQYMKVSRGEPLYREGVVHLNNGFYRRAYNTFSLLLNDYGSYKDSRELREDALSAGKITVAVADFENRSRQRNAHNIIKTLIISEISKLENPFIQVVDDQNIDAFLKEQELAASIGSDIRVGKLMAAKAFLTGSLMNLSVNEGRSKRTEKRAYLKEVIETEDNVTREKSTKTIYHKVTYHEIQKENQASGSFHYQLSSTETGAIILSGVAELNPTDRIHYAVFEGNHENLVPGHWEYTNRESPKDKVHDEPQMAKSLQDLFSARQAILTTAALQNKLIEGIAQKVSAEVNDYNPEQ